MYKFVNDNKEELEHVCGDAIYNQLSSLNEPDKFFANPHKFINLDKLTTSLSKLSNKYKISDSELKPFLMECYDSNIERIKKYPELFNVNCSEAKKKIKHAQLKENIMRYTYDYIADYLENKEEEMDEDSSSDSSSNSEKSTKSAKSMKSLRHMNPQDYYKTLKEVKVDENDESSDDDEIIIDLEEEIDNNNNNNSSSEEEKKSVAKSTTSKQSDLTNNEIESDYDELTEEEEESAKKFVEVKNKKEISAPSISQNDLQEFLEFRSFLNLKQQTKLDKNFKEYLTELIEEINSSSAKKPHPSKIKKLTKKQQDKILNETKKKTDELLVNGDIKTGAKLMAETVCNIMEPEEAAEVIKNANDTIKTINRVSFKEEKQSKKEKEKEEEHEAEEEVQSEQSNQSEEEEESYFEKKVSKRRKQ